MGDSGSNQEFAVEIPKTPPSQPKKRMNVFVIIVIVVAVIGLIILALPFIICGAFLILS